MYEIAHVRQGAQPLACRRIHRPQEVTVAGDVLDRRAASGGDLIEPGILDGPDELNQVQLGAGHGGGGQSLRNVSRAHPRIDRMPIELELIHDRFQPDQGTRRGRQVKMRLWADLVEREGPIVVPPYYAGLPVIEHAGRGDGLENGRKAERGRWLLKTSRVLRMF